MSRLVLRNVMKNYGGLEVIKGVDLDIAFGEFCVFVGPSGCGKSTLLKMISGLESISDGEIAIDDQVVNDVPPADRGLAMVFQSYALYPHMSVRQNLSFGLENLNTPKASIAQKIAEVAKMLQIEPLLNRRPGQLSGGQRQRVAIGRAVVREPKIFLFDEPLSNLDAELRVEMRGEIARLHRRLGNTMIYVTHDQVEAMTMADKIAVLRSGKVEQFGAPLELYNNPANVFVAGFIGSPKMNFFQGTIQAADGKAAFVQFNSGERIPVSQDVFHVSHGLPVTLGIRPNHVTPGPVDATDIKGVVQNIEQLGGESHLYISAVDGTPTAVHVDGQTEIALGETIGLKLDTSKVQLFSRDTGGTLRR